MSNETITSLASNPWITLGGFIVGFLGLILAIVFYVKAKKDRIPLYEYASRTIIDVSEKTLDELQLIFKGIQQKRITITKIVLWNEGHQTIDRKDFVVLDPIRIICPSGIEVLDARVVDVSASPIDAKVMPLDKLDGGQVFKIEFGYLDHRDHLTVQLTHTGREEEIFVVSGKIKGASKIARLSNAQTEQRLRKMVRFGWLLENIINSRLWRKYVGAGVYLLFSGFGIWLLLAGKTDWYIWLATIFCFLAATLIYFGSRVVPPAKI